jgi:hypothetical protein
LEDASEFRRAVRTPTFGDDDRCVMGLAAGADDLISHYPDLGNSGEADALVPASRCQLLDSQTDCGLDGESIHAIGMMAATTFERASHEGRQAAPDDQGLIGESVETFHQ